MNLKSCLFLLASLAATPLAFGQSDGELGLESESVTGLPRGRFTLKHTVANQSWMVASNVWLTNQLPTGVSFLRIKPGAIDIPGNLRTAPIGPGTFATPFSPISPPAVALALGDLDRDGRPDLVAAHGTNANGFSVWRSTGTNLPSVPTTNPTPTPPKRVVLIGDFNGDGRPDIVAAGANDNLVTTFYEDSGSLSDPHYAPGTSNSFPNPITGLAVADFDRDGRLDLVVLEPATSSLHLLRNSADTGEPGFTSVGVLPCPPNPLNLVAHHDADDDCDGTTDDLFVTSEAAAGGMVSVFRHLCSPDPTGFYAARTDYPCGPTPRGLAVADLDGDGIRDVVIANGPARTLTLLRGNPDDTLTNVGVKDSSASGNAIAVHLLDLDGDGRPELITGSGGQPDCIVIPNSRSSVPLSPAQFGTAVHFALPAPFRNLALDTCSDGSQAGGFIAIGHTGPNQGSVPGGQSFSVLRLTQPGAVISADLGDLSPGHSIEVPLDLEVRLPGGTNVAFAVATGGGADPTIVIPHKLPLAVVCGSLFCVSGGATQPMGGFPITVVMSGTGLYHSNTVVTMPDGSYCLELPFACGGFPWDTTITITTPACPGQVWTFPYTVLFASLTIPPLICNNCNTCTTVQTVLNLYSGRGPSGLLPTSSLDPQFTTGIPPFTTPNPYVTSASSGWLANGPNSQWVGPDPSFQSPPGVYYYTNKFYLPCTNSARVTGQWTAAGEGAAVLLNGLATGISLTGFGFEANWNPFNILSGFVIGANELVFCVTNAPSTIGLPFNPTGLRVELTGRATCCSSCLELKCPTNIVKQVCTNGPAPHGLAVNYPAPTAISHCGSVSSVSCTPPSGSFFPLGTNVVVCTATDSFGNSASCSFSIIVRPDFTPPIVQCPPLNISVTGCPPIMPSLTNNIVVMDNCSSPSQITISQSIPPGTPLTGGQNVAIIHVCDAAGNCRDCDVIINAVPTSGNPTITCPPDQVILTCSNSAKANFKVNVTGQNGPVVCTPPSGSTFPIGVTYVTCTATNSCGGIATCYFSITVKPHPSPRWFCRQVGIGIPYDVIGGATAALRPGLGLGYPAICVFPNPANPNSGVLLDIGSAQAVTFTTMLDFTAPEGSGFEIFVPPSPGHPNPPIVSMRSKGKKGYCVKTNKRYAEPGDQSRAFAVNTNGNLLDSLTFTAAEIDATGVFDILFQDGVSNCHVTIELDMLTGSVSIDFPGPVTESALRKGWDGCIYGPDRPVKKPTSRVMLVPPVTPGLPPVSELSLQVSGWTEMGVEEPSITAAGRKWGDGHVTLMKAYDDGETMEFRAFANGGGVHVDLGHTESFNVLLEKFENGDIPNQDELLTRTVGPIRGLTNRPPHLDSMLLKDSSQGVECSVDFTPIDSPTVRVLVYNQGTLVAQRAGVPASLGQPVLILPTWPTSLGKLGAATPCRRGTIKIGTIRLPGSGGFLGGLAGTPPQEVEGDEFRILAEPTPGAPQPEFYDRFDFISNDGPTWRVSGIVRTLACPPATHVNISPGSDTIQITWQSGNYRLQGAEDITGPWLDLGVGSPVSLSSESSARFFRLVCD